MDILHATGVYKGFETGEGSLQVLRGVSLSLQAGQSLALTGEISILGLFFLASCLAPYIRPLIFVFSNKVSGTGGFMFRAW